MQKSISLKNLTEEQIKEVVKLVNNFRKENIKSSKSSTTQNLVGDETIDKISNIEKSLHNSELCNEAKFYMCKLYYIL